MTIFVASVFLPYTVHFEVAPTSRQSPKQPSITRNPSAVRVGDYNDTPALSLFTQSPATPDLPTPSLVEEHTDFFTAGLEFSAAAKVAHPQDEQKRSSSLGALMPSEPHSPAWGRKGVFNQPPSRAEGPPPSSVLKHEFIPEKRSHSRTVSAIEVKEESRERALKTAEWTIQPSEQGNSGLRNAARAATLADENLEMTWVGTLGMPTDVLTDEQKSDIENTLETDHECLTVYTSDSDIDGHYTHFCKTILWPMFHYQIPDNPKSKAYEDHSWVYYVKVNQDFADRIIKSYKRGDVIWIHDYHLLLVPGMIREKLPDAQIGLFMHIAFPSSEVFRCLSVRNELLKGMLGANLIGFQIQEYGVHFLQTCSRLLFVEATPNGVQLEDRFVDVASFPIGLDLNFITEHRNDSETKQWVDKIQQKYEGKYLIVARDKLDHVRGVRQKLLAYELFLNKYPEFAEKVVLIQVATSTTEQAELESMVSDIVTRINSEHSTLAHQPLVFLKQDMEYHRYLAMLTSADALMITSLREGMNLTSHEFIFCQDGEYGIKKHGALILSEFTGSASIFEGNDLAVNPWDYRQCSEAIRKALQMNTEDKTRRWTRLMELVKVNDGAHWFTSFLAALDFAWNQHARQHTSSIPRLSLTKLAESYQASKTRLFMLDYEGTLASHDVPSQISFNSPQRTIDAISNLVSKPGNIVYVMSGKRPEELHILFERVPGLGMVAENGCFLKYHDSEQWDEAADIEAVREVQDGIRNILQHYSVRAEGSYIESRHCSMILSTKNAKDPVNAQKLAAECASHITDACHNLNIHAVPIEGGLVVESTKWSKGTAATRILERIKAKAEENDTEKPSFLMVAGDAREDEVVYRWANALGREKKIQHVTTVSVSSRNTEAMTTLTRGVTGVLSTLHKLAATG